MRKFILVGFLVILVTITLQGCVYTNITTPLDINLNRTELGSKVGESSWQSVLWLFAWGDAGTKEAAKNGQITTVNHADSKQFMVLLGVYRKVTTVVYGD